MELTYTNHQPDYIAFIEREWKDRKQANRNSYYQEMLYHSGILALGIFTALVAEQVFVLTLFGLLLVWYWTKNWSFDRAWQRRIRDAATRYSDTQNTLILNETGIEERLAGNSIRIPWKNVVGYQRSENR